MTLRNILANTYYFSGMSYPCCTYINANGTFPDKDVFSSGMFSSCKDHYQDTITELFRRVEKNILPIESVTPTVAWVYSKMHETYQNVLDLMNQIEAAMHWKRTTAELVQFTFGSTAHPGVIYTGSNQWLRHPCLITIWTLLGRIGVHHTIGTPWKESLKTLSQSISSKTSDAGYLNTSMETLLSLIDNRMCIFSKDKMANWLIKDNFNHSHSHSGIVAFSVLGENYKYPFDKARVKYEKRPIDWQAKSYTYCTNQSVYPVVIRRNNA